MRISSLEGRCALWSHPQCVSLSLLYESTVLPSKKRAAWLGLLRESRSEHHVMSSVTRVSAAAGSARLRFRRWRDPGAQHKAKWSSVLLLGAVKVERTWK